MVKDPKEKRNLIDERPDEAKRLSALYGRYFRRATTGYVKGIQGKYEVSSTGIE